MGYDPRDPGPVMDDDDDDDGQLARRRQNRPSPGRASSRRPDPAHGPLPPYRSRTWNDGRRLITTGIAALRFVASRRVPVWVLGYLAIEGCSYPVADWDPLRAQTRTYIATSAHRLVEAKGSASERPRGGGRTQGITHAAPRRGLDAPRSTEAMRTLI